MGLSLKGEALKIIVKLFLILWKRFRVPFIKKIFEKQLRESLKILRSTIAILIMPHIKFCKFNIRCIQMLVVFEVH